MKTPLFLISIVSFAAILVAQTNGPVGPIDDATAQAFFAKFSRWQMFLIPATLVIVELLKRGITIIPSGVIPWTAPFIGVALQYLGSKAGFWTNEPAVGVAFGGLATWFNEAGGGKAINKMFPQKPPTP